MRNPVNITTIRAASLKLFAEGGYRATTVVEIGAALGIRGPSLYKHMQSKQDLLAAIMIDTMQTLLHEQKAAVAQGGNAALKLNRMVTAHVKFHATHREEAFVGNREINNLERANRAVVVGLRESYVAGLRMVINEGRADGLFDVQECELTSNAILEMGIGVATWFRSDGPHSADEVAAIYADLALRMVGARQCVGDSPPFDGR
jgi:AcrR family transcriptional regulator